MDYNLIAYVRSKGSRSDFFPMNFIVNKNEDWQKEWHDKNDNQWELGWFKEDKENNLEFQISVI